MSIRSHLIELVSLSLHWRGYELVISEMRGVIGCKENGIATFYSKGNTDYQNEEWLALIEFERAHGWFSVRCLSGPALLRLNGRLLTNSPLLIKESSLMMPPHSSQYIELFLSESLSDWDAFQAEAELLESGQHPSGKKSLVLQYPRYVSDEAVQAQKIARLGFQCDADYGLMPQLGELIILENAYHFGAVRFEITDDECWVICDDGVLRVNGLRCHMGQVFVGDQIQWQENVWFLVGQSGLQRSCEVDEVKEKVKSDKSDVDDLFLIDDFKRTFSRNYDPMNAKKSFKLNSNSDEIFDENELVEFRKKLHAWLSSELSSDPLERSEFKHYVYDDSKNEIRENVKQIARLKLGRRATAWQSADVQSEKMTAVDHLLPLPSARQEVDRAIRWHNALIIIASLSGGALFATLLVLLFLV